MSDVTTRDIFSVSEAYDLNYGHDTYNGDDDYNSFYSEYDRFWKIKLGFDIPLLLVGTFLNLWFLKAILRSRDLRSLVRNKIICSLFVLHLVDSAVVIPGYCYIAIKYLYGYNVSCQLLSHIETIEFIGDSIANWQIFILIVLFISQILDYNPATKFTPWTVRIGTWALLLIPWVVSIVVISASTDVEYDCFYVPFEIRKVLIILNTAVPLILSVLLTIVAVVLRYRRFNHEHNTVPLCPRPKIDSSLAYIAAVTVSIVCDILLLIVVLNNRLLIDYGYKTRYRMLTAVYILSSIRVVVMVFPWLLLPDIREQIKTWRPWKRSIPSADMTVTYSA